jgi:hypothetical protein
MTAGEQLNVMAEQQAWLLRETAATRRLRESPARRRRLRELFARNEQLGRDLVRLVPAVGGRFAVLFLLAALCRGAATGAVFAPVPPEKLMAVSPRPPKTNVVQLSWQRSLGDTGQLSYVFCFGTNSALGNSTNAGSGTNASLSLRVGWSWQIGLRARDTNGVLSELSNVVSWPLTNCFWRNVVQSGPTANGPWTNDGRWPVVNLTNPGALYLRIKPEGVLY